MADEVDWKASLPPELKDAPSIQKFTDVPNLAKSYLELEKMNGNSIRPPGPDAAPEVKKEFLEKFTKLYPELVNKTDENALLLAMGKPEKPDGYTPPTELRDVPPDVVNSWRETAAALGLTKKQAEVALKKQFENYTQQTAMIAAAQNELKQHWGAALEERTKLAAVAAEKNGFPEEVINVIKSGKGAAKEVQAFYNMAKTMGLDQPANPMGQQGPGSTPGALAPVEIMLRIDEIRKRPEYWEPRGNTLLHEHLKAEVVKLYEQLPQQG